MLRDEIMRLEALDLDMPADTAPLNAEIAASIDGVPGAIGPKGRPRRGSSGGKTRRKSKHKHRRRPGRMV